MSTVRTSIGIVESARRQRVEQTGSITQTNTQKALEELDTRVGSSLSGVRRAVTSNDSLSVSDKGRTIALGGNSLFTFTVPGSGFPSPFVVEVINEDSGRGKFISISGYSTFILWPKQHVIVQNQAGVWEFNAPGKWNASGSVQFNVDHANGSDTTADGLGTGTGAFATNFHAWQVFQTSVNVPAGFSGTIKVADLSFTENPPGAFLGPSNIGGGGNVIFLVGNESALVTWNTSGLTFDDFSVFSLRGFKFAGTGTGQSAISIPKGGLLVYTNDDFGLFTNGNHIVISEGATAVFENGGTYTISGNMASHVVNDGGTWEITGIAISMPNALTFTNFYIGSGSGSNSSLGSVTFTGVGAGAGSTGKQYDVARMASLSLNGVTLPGNVAGTSENGYIDATDGLGSLKATTFNGLTISTTSGTLTVTNGKTLSVANTITLNATDGSGINFSGGGIVAYNNQAIVGATYNGLSVTNTTGTITINNGKTLGVSNTITFSAGADGQTFTFPSVSDSIPGLATANTFTANQAITESVNASSPMLLLTNSNGGSSAAAPFGLSNGTSSITIQMNGTAKSFGPAGNGEGLLLTNSPGYSVIVNNASGKFKIATGGTTENFEFDQAGQFYVETMGTTASAANVFVDTGTTPAGQLKRSTSSLLYKRDVEPLDHDIAVRVLKGARPIWYRSKIEGDRSDWSWYGFGAEDMAELDPRLVHWGYQTDDFELIPVTWTDNDGNEVEGFERKRKDGAITKPDGVQYERLTAHLVAGWQHQERRIADLERELEELRKRLDLPRKTGTETE